MMERPAYIYTSGSPLQHTPMHLDEAEMYGFLIKGDRTKLQATVDATLNKVVAGQITFRVLSPYILLTFTRVNHAQSSFPADHVRGWGKECDIIPWIMVGQMEESGGTEKLHRIFLHPSYTWVDVPMAVSIGREVFGYPKNICQVDMPDVGDDPVTFAIICEGWQPFGAQTQLGMQPLLEITATNTDNPHVSVPGLQGVIFEGFRLLKWVPDLLSLEPAGIAELESLLLQPHIDQLFLKQFPDTSGVKAVYQAVVVAPATIDEVRSAELLGYAYECTIHRFDSYRLDETLGLQLGAQSVLMPFHISMDFTVEAGEELFETTACPAGASDGSAQTAATTPQQNASGEAEEELLQTPAAGRQKNAILGGGIGAMTAAFYLTDQPGASSQYDITVYQMGWRLGANARAGEMQSLPSASRSTACICGSASITMASI
jgi:NAD(P)-binding Rossmann-like domain